ncbi:Fic family protein [Dehalogenimonas formicexedens]|uniref:Fic family protein n=1 Tax=Dehalogenimonas formicexedens TaxID=1839801 RepID=A0A1P8F5R4_9CHLR|nr:Fic family protein [Dehalogenimonas formicexedens]APV43819.1 Fic family protein [Dehalogenimonas formicexedens]
MSNIIGELKSQPKGFKVFIPHPFPPLSGFDLGPLVARKNEEASRLIGKLDYATKSLPDMDYFLLMYLRKDAASSSQIEGTQATMEDAIEAEVQMSSKIPPDVDDIQHYIKALHYGIKRVAEDKFPLALRFISELHRELVHQARVSGYVIPGEFRTEQVWLGSRHIEEARFVPPPVADMQRALGDLEGFINADDAIPVLIKAGIIHSQFETIHPFKDGNGRTGRMLINFYLLEKGYLDRPVLFLSSFFKRHRALYYDKLEAYHNGRIDEWIGFFLDGVIDIAGESIETITRISALSNHDMGLILAGDKRAIESSKKVLVNLYAQPIVNVTKVQEWAGFFTRRGASRLIERFIEMGILQPKAGSEKYGRLYEYKAYMDIFNPRE